MDLGKAIRLARLFSHASGRFCSVAVDHFIGYQTGLPEGLRDLRSTLEVLVAGRPDAVTMHIGVAKTCWPPLAGRVPLIIQSIIGRPDDTADEHLCIPEDAVRVGVDAFATCAFRARFQRGCAPPGASLICARCRAVGHACHRAHLPTSIPGGQR